MKVHFDGLARPARVAKLLRAELAAAGITLGLAKAHDITAEAFGWSDHKELRTAGGSGPASPWDEDCPADVVEARRARQAKALVGAGLSAEAAAEIVARIRPSGRKLGHSIRSAALASGKPSGASSGAVEPVRLTAGWASALSAPGGRYELWGEARSLVAALKDGTLLVAHEIHADRATALAVERLGRLGFDPERTILGTGVEVAHANGVDPDAQDTIGPAPTSFLDVLREAVWLDGTELRIAVRSREHLGAASISIKVGGRWRQLGLFPDNKGAMLYADALNFLNGNGRFRYDPPFDTGSTGGRIDRAAILKSFGKNIDVAAGFADRLREVRVRLARTAPDGLEVHAAIHYRGAEAAPRDQAAGSSRWNEGFDDAQFAVLRRLVRKPSGIALFVGPSGSGKSHTVSRLLGAGGDPALGRRIATVFDKPGHEIPGAVAYDAGAVQLRGIDEDMADGIAQVLATDPDVLVVGNVQGPKALRAAWQAGLAGKQVWLTMRGDDAFKAVEQLVDLGLEPRKLADSSVLNAIVAQRLVRPVCPLCSVPYELALEWPGADRARVEEIGHALKGSDGFRYVRKVRFARREGCSECQEGRVGTRIVAEAVVPTPSMLEEALNGQIKRARWVWSAGPGRPTILETALLQVIDGTLDPDEVEAKVGLLDDVPEGRIDQLMGHGKAAA